jgi:hypothetical protein
VVTVTGLSACAGTATNFVDLPTLPQLGFLVIFVLLTALLAWQAQPLKKTTGVRLLHQRSDV